MSVGFGLARRFGSVFGLSAPATSTAPATVAEPAANVSLTSPGQAGETVVTKPTVPGEAEFTGKRALVADDSEINRTILRTFLERLGFEVTLASDGLQAVELWRPEHDLLCLDIEMPQMDGMLTFIRIRSEVLQRGLPMPMALAVTINAMTDEVTSYMQAGFDGCLPKPFSRIDLVNILHRRWPSDS